MNFVDASLLRFCKLRFSVQKLRLSIGHPGIDGSFSLIDNWIGLVVENEVIDIDTPNLVSFSYHSDQIPISSINAPCPWEVGFDSGRPLDTRWYLNLKDFLGTSKQIKNLCIYVKSREWLYDKLRKQDAKCCSSHSIKCWQQDLKDCKIDGFTPYGDADDADIDDLMIMLLKIPPGVLKFHLDW
ncbi:hypothetical protein EZV62_003910 [Acer yangbiense]|uniref:FBD domain-containing protein n=1 Tax=Acer yangbiense TaxID=1000413 RepID=A0A5C7IIR3_9ROSI|nr:hypothetical protein EZV62_003910 [Acer yangbiense]